MRQECGRRWLSKDRTNWLSSSNGKAFYSLQPFSCPFLVRPLVKACHFIASYNFPMSFQNLSTYPLSDPNSWLENHLQDPPPKRNQDFRSVSMGMEKPCTFGKESKRGSRATVSTFCRLKVDENKSHALK